MKNNEWPKVFKKLKYLILSNKLPHTIKRKATAKADIPIFSNIKKFPNQSPNLPNKLEDSTDLSQILAWLWSDSQFIRYEKKETASNTDIPQNIKPTTSLILLEFFLKKDIDFCFCSAIFFIIQLYKVKEKILIIYKSIILFLDTNWNISHNYLQFYTLHPPTNWHQYP